MSVWKSLSSKPYLWLLAGVVVGGAGLSAVRESKAHPTSGMTKPPVHVSMAAAESRRAHANLAELDQEFVDLAEQVSPYVVAIQGGEQSTVDGKDQFAVRSEGSGVIYRSDGYILTNDHVVNGYNKVKVVFNDGEEVTGTVIRAGDTMNDIAVVKVDKTNLTAAPFADSGAVRTGQIAVALGAPFGIENTMTAGHISGLGRSQAIPDQRLNGTGVRVYTGMLQTDAAINPGNSGGPLFNVDGQVIGINSSIAANPTAFGGAAGNVGVGFALPSNQAKFFADLIIERGGKITRAYMGLAPRDLKPYEKKKFDVPGGAYVANVPAQGSPSHTAGINEGDIVTRIGDLPIETELDLRNAMYKYQAGQSVKVDFVRNGKVNTVDVKLIEVPKDLARSNQPRQDNSPFVPKGNDDGGIDDLFKDLPDRIKQFHFKGDGDSKEEPAPRADRSGKVSLGVSVSELSSGPRNQYKVPANVKGVLVLGVNPGSKAADLGIEEGSVITNFNGKALSSVDDLVSELAKLKWGDTTSIRWVKYNANGMSTFERPFQL
ncbi:MAG: trypsin-like peptidase domain-containing protein [Armatimonadetes bacterium]|nr:trypsin-like peptidase domain-containing protein [Armatimonadota bacterium]